MRIQRHMYYHAPIQWARGKMTFRHCTVENDSALISRDNAIDRAYTYEVSRDIDIDYARALQLSFNYKPHDHCRTTAAAAHVYAELVDTCQNFP